MWSETVGLSSRLVWDQKIGLGLEALVLCSDINKDITPKAKDTNLKAKATTPKAKDSTLKAKIKDVTVEGKKFKNNWQSNSTFY